MSGMPSEDRVCPEALVALPGRPLLGLPAVLAVSLGTGLTADLVWDRSVPAVAAEAQFLGLLPSLLLVATAIGRRVWVLASELFVTSFLRTFVCETLSFHG